MTLASRTETITSLTTAFGLVISVLAHQLDLVGNNDDGFQMVLFSLCGMSNVFYQILALQTEIDHQRRVIQEAVTLVYNEFYERNGQNRKRRNPSENTGTRKRRKTKHDHERAWECVKKDCLGSDTIFTDRQFEETYRLTKTIVERIICACCRNKPRTFAPRPDAASKRGIRAEVKVLAVLKMIAFGCAGTCIRDYTQMGLTTQRESLKEFFKAILGDDELRTTYLRTPSPADARRLSRFHKQKHGVAGMLGSLDCLHVYWKNCPVGLQGHFKKGTEKPHSSVVLEAMADHNTWFWHLCTGHAGTNNDINIWDVSPLLRAFLSDHWNTFINFKFKIDGVEFDKLWVLVDGIYPTIARFVKTISFPIGRAQELFVKWQESCRKDIERAFGILVRKFQILARPIEYWDLEDVKRIIYGCCLMHNMMVECRMERHEEENEDMYRLCEEEGGLSEEHFQRVFRSMRGLPSEGESMANYMEMQNKRWEELYSEESHVGLQERIMNQVARTWIENNKQVETEALFIVKLLVFVLECERNIIMTLNHTK